MRLREKQAGAQPFFGKEARNSMKKQNLTAPFEVNELEKIEKLEQFEEAENSGLPPDFLPFTNDFIFSLVMRDPEICRGILEAVIPNEEFSEIKLMKSQNPLIDEEENEAGSASFSSEIQKSLKFVKDMHGVRFDAFIKSENTWAEIEMQTTSELLLGKRARYYQANMDLDCLEEGDDYEKLKKCYVIFLCTFDYFRKGDPVYFFRSWDVEKGLPLDDFSYKIVLNSSCAPEKVPEALKPLYAYLNDPHERLASSLTRRIDERVRKFNSDDWRRKYMTFEHMLNERERKGIERGRAEGRKESTREIARNLKALRLPIAQISEATGLSAAEIEAL